MTDAPPCPAPCCSLQKEAAPGSYAADRWQHAAIFVRPLLLAALLVAATAKALLATVVLAADWTALGATLAMTLVLPVWASRFGLSIEFEASGSAEHGQASPDQERSSRSRIQSEFPRQAVKTMTVHMNSFVRSTHQTAYAVPPFWRVADDCTPVSSTGIRGSST